MNKIANLAAMMGVSEQDASDFVAGVSIQMKRGLSLDDAIRAHAAMWRQAFDAFVDANASQTARGDAHRAAQVGFVVDTFYGAGA